MATNENRVEVNRKCNTPRPLEECEAATREFWDDLRAAREKHGLSDVFVVIQFQAAEGPMMTSGHIGIQTNCEAMAAYGLGYAQRDRQEMIAEQIRNAGAVSRGPRG